MQCLSYYGRELHTAAGARPGIFSRHALLQTCSRVHGIVINIHVQHRVPKYAWRSASGAEDPK